MVLENERNYLKIPYVHPIGQQMEIGSVISVFTGMSPAILDTSMSGNVSLTDFDERY